MLPPRPLLTLLRILKIIAIFTAFVRAKSVRVALYEQPLMLSPI